MDILKYTLIVLIGLSLIAFLVYPYGQEQLSLERLLQVAKNTPDIYNNVIQEIKDLEPPTFKIAPGYKNPYVPEIITGVNSIIKILWSIGEATIFTGALLYQCIVVIRYIIVSLI